MNYGILRPQYYFVVWAALLVLVVLPVQANELALYMPFDGTTVDVTGKGGGGSGVDLTVAKGAVGAAYSFNGTTSHITFGDLGFLNGGDNWVIEFWFRAKDVAALSSPLDLHGEAKIVIQIENGVLLARSKVGGIWRNLPAYVETGSWYHLRYTYDTAFGTRLLINGEEVASDAAVGLIPPEEDETFNRVGSYFRNNQYFDGRIDDLRIYRWN